MDALLANFTTNILSTIRLVIPPPFKIKNNHRTRIQEEFDSKEEKKEEGEKLKMTGQLFDIIADRAFIRPLDGRRGKEKLAEIRRSPCFDQ